MPTLDFLQSARKEFAYYRSLGDKTFAQLPDADLFRDPAPGNNSIAVLVKHMHGNMLSRWTDFLTTDGEKPWRQRDAEFENDITTRDALLDRWKEGWNCLFSAIDQLTPADLERTVLIRTEPHSVQQAIVRQLAHLPYHVGQIVLLGKVFLGESFVSLSIPKGGSRQFNAQKGM
ncbi:MAG TPA: DUF1572 family protein [Flavobacteriales bacterium]|nr:DUF1572 family protein [Flavobacteriales bacterium]